nr:hypothetical protein Q903MT_gene2379 [Picea sitchensis]
MEGYIGCRTVAAAYRLCHDYSHCLWWFTNNIYIYIYIIGAICHLVLRIGSRCYSLQYSTTWEIYPLIR